MSEGMDAPVLRSLLSVPVLQQRFVDKAATVPADAVVFDLEDSIAPSEKAAARRRLGEVLPTFDGGDRMVMVRPNGLDTGLLEADLDVAVSAGAVGARSRGAGAAGTGLDAVFVPKVHGPDVVRTVDAYLTFLERTRGLDDGRIALVVWIESTAGVARAEDICAASPRLVAAAFGAEDYVTDLGVQRRRDSGEVAYARARVANAARAAGLVAVDCPEPDYRDADGFVADSRRARLVGYRGKFCIHPDQVALANEVFGVDPDELAWARRVAAAFEDGEARGLGAVGLDGAMIDRPVYLRARALLTRAALPQSGLPQPGACAARPPPEGGDGTGSGRSRRHPSGAAASRREGSTVQVLSCRRVAVRAVLPPE
jgi:citrate lyase subunit beta/citryl-CoA lyase